MPLDKSQFDLFYAISTQWTARDQRYQAIIGFEYELCHKSFEQLHELAISEMNADALSWSVNEDRAALGAIMARAFVDHAAGVQKVIRGYSRSGWPGELAQSFYDANRDLFDLRNALQHSYERIDTDPVPDELQPLCGDLSWSELTRRPSMDLYMIAYGPMVGGQFASPSIDMQGFSHFGLNHIYIRAHETAHAGITRGSEGDIRLPTLPSGRVRIDGIQVTPSENGGLRVTA
jgi:hypothetical protein